MARRVGEFGAGLIGVSQLLAPATLGRALWVNLTARGRGMADVAVTAPKAKALGLQGDAAPSHTFNTEVFGDPVAR